MSELQLYRAGQGTSHDARGASNARSASNAQDTRPTRGGGPSNPIVINEDGDESDDFEPELELRVPTLHGMQMRRRPQDALFPLAPPVANQPVPAVWPHRIVHLRSNFNPSGVEFPFVDHFGTCGCTTRCRFPSCQNTLLGLYCARNNCPFSGNCGNGLRESRSLQLMHHPITNNYFIRARRPIERGRVIGEYLGLVTVDNPSAPPVHNRGYRLAMRHASVRHRRRVCIDAATFGSMMRFSNHSCEATARFHQVCNGRHHTIVAVTVRDVQRGEEVTVDYGNDLWFNCSCGRATCRHRDR